MKKHFAKALLAVTSVVLMMSTVPAAAAIDLRGGVYTDLNKPFAGVGFLTHAGGPLYFNPNVEYVFVDNGRFGSLNFDAHYDLPTGSAPYVWVGGGLAIIHSDPEGPGSDTVARANLFAGIGLRTTGSVPYVQAKYISGYGYWVLAAGLRF